MEEQYVGLRLGRRLRLGLGGLCAVGAGDQVSKCNASLLRQGHLVLPHEGAPLEQAAAAAIPISVPAARPLLAAVRGLGAQRGRGGGLARLAASKVRSNSCWCDLEMETTCSTVPGDSCNNGNTVTYDELHEH